MSIIDVNKDEIIPNERVIEKPLMGPDPKTNKRSAAIRVVMFASKIVDKALSKPFLTATKA